MIYGNISPIRLAGCWDDGFALDTYIVRSLPLGTNEYGYLTFDNTYSPIGELLHNMKYNGHIDTSKEILDLAIFKRLVFKCIN